MKYCTYYFRFHTHTQNFIDAPKDKFLVPPLTGLAHYRIYKAHDESLKAFCTVFSLCTCKIPFLTDHNLLMGYFL